MDFFRLIIARYRYVFVAAVLALVLLSLASLMLGVLAGIDLVVNRGEMPPGSGAQMVPYFIRAAFLYFLAAAFSSLFLGDLPVPQWMITRNLFQFRNKVLTFVAVIAALNFLRILADRELEPVSVLYMGGGIFLVLAGIYLLVRKGEPSGDEIMSREGNRPVSMQPKDPRGGRGRKSSARPPEKQPHADKQSIQQREGRPTSEGKPASSVTVKPGPRRPPRGRGSSGRGGSQQ